VFEIRARAARQPKAGADHDEMGDAIWVLGSQLQTPPSTSRGTNESSALHTEGVEYCQQIASEVVGAVPRQRPIRPAVTTAVDGDHLKGMTGEVGDLSL